MKSNAVTPPAAPDLTTDQIWEGFSDRLFAFIRKQVQEEDVAEDLLQDVFEKIHLKRSTLNNNDKLVSWLFQLTRNSIIDYYRRRKVIGPMPEIGYDEMDNSDESLHELTCCIDPFMNILPDEDRLLIQKIDVEGLSQKKLSEEWKIPYPSLKSKVQRARRKLKSMFMSCCMHKFNKRGRLVNQGDSSCRNC